MEFSLDVKRSIQMYTNGQSSPWNRYLARLAGINKDNIPYFDTATWHHIANVMSAIYNSPAQTVDLFQNFKPGFADINAVDSTSVIREGSEKTINVILNSTTADIGVLQYLSPFHGAGCCVRKIMVQVFPILNVSNFSTYKYQNEVILPPFIRIDNGHLTPTTLDEYSEADIGKCAHIVDDAAVLGRSTRALDLDCFRSKPKQNIQILSQHSIVRTIFMDRWIIDYINKILEVYYSCTHAPRTQHGFLHICDTITLTIILYLDWVEQLNRNEDCRVVKNNLENLIIAALFHDAGRFCRDGEDEWEKQSIEIAVNRLLSAMAENGLRVFSEERIRVIVNILGDERDPLHKIMKGADSIDISRVRSYDITHNPLYTEDRYKDKTLIEDGTLTSEFGVVYTLMNAVNSRNLTIITDLAGTGNTDIEFDKQNNKKDEDDLFPIFETYGGLDEISAEQIGDYPHVEDTGLTYTVHLDEFIDTVGETFEHFINQNYFVDRTRLFDDYWEILLCMLPMLKYSLRHLSKVIMPFRIRNLFAPVRREVDERRFLEKRPRLYR